MPRGPRAVCEDAILNITSRGNNKKIIFKKDKDYIYFKELMLKYKRKFNLTIFHYCLMRNHVHIILKIIEPLMLSRAMHGLQLAYFQYFLKRYGYIGRFWQGRFHSKLIEDEKYLLTAGLYIESNPVRAGLVNDPGEYKWSSYNTYAHGTKDAIIDYDPFYSGLCVNSKERERIYKETMQRYLGVENDPLHLFTV